MGTSWITLSMHPAHQQEQGYPRSRISLLFQEPRLSILVLLPLSGISLLLLGNLSDDLFPSGLVFQSLAVVFAPLFFSLTLILFAGFALKNFLKNEKYFGFLIQFIFVSGLVSLITALTLNTRYSNLIYIMSIVVGFLLNSDLEGISNLSFIFFVSIVVPLFEEAAKIIGIFYLSKTTQNEKETGKEVRALNNPGFIIFSAVVVGSIFTFIETYFYSILGSGIFIETTEYFWPLILFQIMVRFGSPLHVASTMISAYGIILSLYEENRPSMSVDSYRRFLPAFFLAWALHGAWNFFAVMSEPGAGAPFGTITLFGFYIPQTFIILTPLIWVVIIGLLVRVRSIETLRCSFCNNWHSPPFSAESHISSRYSQSIFGKVLNQITSYWFRPGICPNCKQPMTNPEICMSCGSRSLYTCPQCFAVIPIWATRCWKCETLLFPPFEATIQFRKSYLDVFSLTILRLYLISYLASALILLFYFKELGQEVRTALLFIVMLILMSGAFFVSYFWSSNDATRGLGIAFARIVTAMFFLLLLALMLMLNLIFLVFWYIFSQTLFFIGLFLMLGLASLFILMITTTLFGGSPLIHPP